ncbi:ester cyclase [Vagococcus lutrae]|uniref:ester cyclase n=1 Tax=Vagococcus lutrae TaxID=81947 RepID=UPI0020101CC3|nr:ester cyclase [Vagococcus lutrae]UQF24130.1 ester cyclase [Vagococcus lutrae]UQF37663.1 ester cyclase [Vagococcus lutrae]UQF63779.1 ester cyclase [Vagococcus lutrae]
MANIQEERHLELFDKMDFDAYSKKDWTLFKALHAPHPKVVMPDGSIVDDLTQHTDDMIYLASFMPDLEVTSHPIKVAMGDWTAVVGVTEGTFTETMMTENGPIGPTGKHMKIRMSTFARWENEQIVEEHLFWDSAEMMKQLGVQ